MNWSDVIKEGILIYASEVDDRSFRTWSVRETICDILYYEIYPLEVIDKIICTILKNNEGRLSEEKLATILGFNIVDNFEMIPKRYADNAEKEIFLKIINSVLQWGLIERSMGYISLTILGDKVLQDNQKYRFFSAKKKIIENEDIKPVEVSLSFFSTLWEHTCVTDIQQIEYSNIDISQIFSNEKTELIKRLNLQSDREYLIYSAKKSEKYYSFSSCQVDIRIYEQGEKYFPIVFYNNKICDQATDLLNSSENFKVKERKIEWGLYLKLIKDETSILNYKAIIPFDDVLDLDYLIKDNRLVWNDIKLFHFIAERSDGNQWSNISEYCPIDILKQYFERYYEKLDWFSISSRINEEFLIKEALSFPWDFDIICKREDISSDCIKQLLLISGLKEQEWDWERIMPMLDVDFIKENIENIDFDLYEITQNRAEDFKPIIIKYPDKKWDWEYISSEYELDYILSNLIVLKDYLKIKKILHRAFSSTDYVEYFTKSTELKQIIIEEKEILSDYSPNLSEYIWKEELIDLLQETGYLQWESTAYTFGFECNEYVEWNHDYFKRYYKNVRTEKGYTFVSSKIEETKIITDYPDFKWDWKEIVNNQAISKDKDFILKIVNDKNLPILLETIEEDEIIKILFEEKDLLEFLEAKPEFWKEVTRKIPIDFCRKHIDYQWDWIELTKRVISSIKIEKIGDPKWVNKWDWEYLTKNIDEEILYDNLDLYTDYWDWEYLSGSLDKEFIFEVLEEYNDKWKWDVLLQRLDKSDLLFSTHIVQVATCISVLDKELKLTLWEIITHKFNYDELHKLILTSNNVGIQEVFLWDYTYFYDLPDFDAKQYLEQYSDIIEWDILSSSKKLNEALKWDKKMLGYDIWLKNTIRILKNKEYHWNFKLLSKLDSINFNNVILKIETKNWDWDYLSEYSSCFKKGEYFKNNFNKFSKYINFTVFSRRTDTGITADLILKYKDREWDWDYLSEYSNCFKLEGFFKDNFDEFTRYINFTVFSRRIDTNITAGLILKYKNKEWDWKVLSDNKKVEISNELLIELSTKDWDWGALSNREELVFSENFIEQLIDKPFDWFVVSSQKTFTPSKKILSRLDKEKINWEAVSQNEEIDMEIFSTYPKYLDWKLVTRNKSFDISDIDLLSKYKNYLDWDFISQSEKFIISQDSLMKFGDKLQWTKINKRDDFIIKEEYLEPFKDVIDWRKVSQSMEIQFTEALIKKFSDYWDWKKLSDNPQIISKLSDFLKSYQSQINSVKFLKELEANGETSYIYHFTHLFNAVNIIKNRKILSRNKAEGFFADAAGSNVHRRDTAHKYARFYFRPQTPTQFYNECLGMDYTMGKYYNRALGLNLPKCPMPVFFKFNLNEVIMKMSDKCYYSTGNMQTDEAIVKKVGESPCLLNTNYLYSDISVGIEYYKKYSQQEFLVEEEFDFSTLDSFEIICYNKVQAELLKSQLVGDPICEKIRKEETIDRIFHRKNRKIEIFVSEKDSILSFFSEYQNEAYLSIRGEGVKEIQILSPKNVIKQTEEEIRVYPLVKFVKEEKSIEVYFVDLTTEKREWLIYKN